MKKTTLYIIRHGQSLGNEKRLYLGHTDMDLSRLGYDQAEETANHLSDVQFSAIYSSDLLRAYNTAVPNAKMREMSVIPSENLREIYLGRWEGKLVDDLINNESELFVDGWHKNFGIFTLPDGESVWDAGNRFLKEVKRIAELHQGENILIASHAAVIRSFWGIISGIKKEEMADKTRFPTNASYSVAEFDGVRFVPIKYSCDGHLTVSTSLSGEKKKND